MAGPVNCRHKWQAVSLVHFTFMTAKQYTGLHWHGSCLHNDLNVRLSFLWLQGAWATLKMCMCLWHRDQLKAVRKSEAYKGSAWVDSGALPTKRSCLWGAESNLTPPKNGGGFSSWLQMSFQSTGSPCCDRSSHSHQPQTAIAFSNCEALTLHPLSNSYGCSHVPEGVELCSACLLGMV